MKHELRSQDDDSPSEQRLRVYRSVFADFSESFVTYKPLLNAIQREYERTIESLKVRLGTKSHPI